MSSLLETAREHWIGRRVRQVRCSSPEFKEFIGRESTVTDLFEDEKHAYHVLTEDGIWCPVLLMEEIP